MYNVKTTLYGQFHMLILYYHACKVTGHTGHTEQMSHHMIQLQYIFLFYKHCYLAMAVFIMLSFGFV